MKTQIGIRLISKLWLDQLMVDVDRSREKWPCGRSISQDFNIRNGHPL